MRYALLSIFASMACALHAVERATLNETGGPVSNVNIIAPLTIEEAQRWQMYSQVVMVKEKDEVLVDTAEIKGHTVYVHSISYFRASSGQLYAIVNYLRPRTVLRENR